MRIPALNTLTPWGWTAAGLAAVVILALAATSVGLRWDPFGLSQRRLDRARAELAAAQSEVAARRIEQSAEAGQRARLDIHHQQAVAVAEIAAAGAAEAQGAPDAEIPIDPDRARRLRDIDRRLCDAAAGLAGCAAASAAAG